MGRKEFREIENTMNIVKKIERLLEATLTGGYLDIGLNSVCGDDDHPTGNILMGVPYERKTVKTPGGSYRMYIPREEWQWDEFERAKGMEFIRNYHPTLADDKILKSHFGNRVFRYSRKKVDPTKAMAKINIARDKDPDATMHGIENIEQTEEPTIKEDILVKIDRQIGEEK